MTRRFITALALMAGAVLLIAGGPALAVDGPHDLTAGTYAITGLTNPCLPCHAPHNAQSGVGTLPLSNRTTLPSGPWTTYTSESLTVTPTDPAGVSLMCMSCHDGTIAIDSYGGASGSSTITAGSTTIVGASGDVSDQHPIAISIGASTKADIATATAVTTAGLHLYSDGTNTDVMRCGTCHDPHDNTTVGNYLRLAAPGLCTTCHTGK